VLRACAAGLACAAVCILGWIKLALSSGTYSPLPATMLALLVTWAMLVFGRGHRGPRLQLATATVCVLAIAVGNYLVVNALVHALAAKTGHEVPRLIGSELFLRAWSQLGSGAAWLYFGLALPIALLVPRRKPELDQGGRTL
jgi:hypothetical protein